MKSGVTHMNLDYLRALKEHSGLTDDQIANLSNVPKSTVVHILSGKTQNPGFSNVVDIVRALDGSLDDMEGIEKEGETPVQRESESKLVLLYREVIRYKNQWIKTLAIALGIVMAIVLFLLVFDIMNPTVGWFQR